ncbi:GNAT family N-acetyltransferase [Nocardioides sp. AE5]|uniref:GNAT family N-acetyltransferase n=1 Tax=Nocardioides sp. AE5 TaxID=2962573 RepID=UPI002880F64B|nr:GNAT family N-acetyltransferase [Nocardioides sp. AE5]MDT0203526.1 GNAT family N-acetyltransferase [Nocardioides sp. AE5]
MTSELLRPSEPSDADALTDLHLDVWEEAYGHLIDEAILRNRRADRAQRVARWREILDRSADRTHVVEAAAGGRLLGFVSAGPGRDDPEPGLPDVEVWALYVRAEVYGQGFGHALLEKAIGPAAAYLWVLDGNERAIAFYERQGFVFDGSSKVEPVGVERRMVRT